jgi:hypothetical protein
MKKSFSFSVFLCVIGFVGATSAFAGGRPNISDVDAEVKSVSGLKDLSVPCVLEAKSHPEKSENQQMYAPVFMNAELVQKDIDRGLLRLTPEQRDHSRIVIKNKRIFNCMGEAVPDTSSKITYVMDLAGNVYLFDEFTYRLVRHSSILWEVKDGKPQGAAVAAAGEIMIKDQMVVMLNHTTGHYPSSEKFHQVKTELSDVIAYPADR